MWLAAIKNLTHTHCGHKKKLTLSCHFSITSLLLDKSYNTLCPWILGILHNIMLCSLPILYSICPVSSAMIHIRKSSKHFTNHKSSYSCTSTHSMLNMYADELEKWCLQSTLVSDSAAAAAVAATHWISSRHVSTVNVNVPAWQQWIQLPSTDNSQTRQECQQGRSHARQHHESMSVHSLLCSSASYQRRTWHQQCQCYCSMTALTMTLVRQQVDSLTPTVPLC